MSNLTYLMGKFKNVAESVNPIFLRLFSMDYLQGKKKPGRTQCRNPKTTENLFVADECEHATVIFGKWFGRVFLTHKIRHSPSRYYDPENPLKYFCLKVYISPKDISKNVLSYCVISSVSKTSNNSNVFKEWKILKSVVFIL